MSRHRLKHVIVVIAFVAIANPVLAGLNDSRTALFGRAASSAGDRAPCPGAEAGERQ